MFIAVILCEPPLDKVFRAKSLFSQEIKSSTFQGGYMDFIDFDDLTQNGLDGNFDGPPRSTTFVSTLNGIVRFYLR